MGMCSYAELDHEGFPVGPNSVDFMPVYLKAMLGRSTKFCDQKCQDRLLKQISSLEEGNKRAQKPWIDLMLLQLDTVIFHEVGLQPKRAARCLHANSSHTLISAWSMGSQR